MKSLFLSILLCLFSPYVLLPQLSGNKDSTYFTAYVNPFIGTSNGGNTFPGALVPWGMVSVSPHNSLSAPSGYIYGEKEFFGLGMVHLSGTGCSELGSVLLTISDNDSSFIPDSYKTNYSDETASPGYYSVVLNDLHTKIEASATERAGILRITSFSNSTKTLVVDAGRSLAITGGGGIKIISENEIEGYNISGGFCGEDNREEVYFAARFSKRSNGYKLWRDNELITSSEAEIINSQTGALIQFELDEDEELLVKIGISYVSIENARQNLDAEIIDFNFDRIKEIARNKWEDQLKKIKVEDNSRDNLVKFYTAVYHTLIHPNIISDVNGDYPLMGRTGIGNYSGRNRYTVFSLWDTYRTLHPFYNLVFPEVQSEIINTMIDMYKESGYLPKWELAGIETYMMVGDPAAIVIADSYVKGITDYNASEAFEAVLKPVMLNPSEKAPPVRAGYHELLKYGYIPFEQNWNDDWWVWGPVSTTLEYCLSDFAISRMARKLGESDIERILYRRSLNYKNLFDSATGFIRPKLKNGNWMEPFDQFATEGSGDWIGAGGPGYVEGNAWNYTFFVPHDIKGLISLFGGERNFSEKLYQSFFNGQFTINNEPDIAYPYLFRYIKGEEHKTPELVRNIMDHYFGTDHNGLPGNDDCGTISAWFIFSALGFYPDCPAEDYYTFGFPLFNKTTIILDPRWYAGGKIIIEKKSDSFDAEIYINNEPIDGYRLYHDQLKEEASVIFK